MGGRNRPNQGPSVDFRQAPSPYDGPRGCKGESQRACEMRGLKLSIGPVGEPMFLHVTLRPGGERGCED